MEVAHFESDHYPRLHIEVTINERTFGQTALIDTGFDGDLVVPPNEIAGRSPDEYRTWALADSSVVATPIFYGAVQIGSMPPLEVDIAVLGDEAIIGRGVLDNYRVTIHHGRRVVFEL